jgi:hypothetical protein
MGMFDTVNVAIPCPECGYEGNDYQSKDLDCTLALVEVDDLISFYTSCDACRAWVEFSKGKSALTPTRSDPRNRKEVEELYGFKLD